LGKPWNRRESVARRFLHPSASGIDNLCFGRHGVSRPPSCHLPFKTSRDDQGTAKPNACDANDQKPKRQQADEKENPHCG